MDMYISERLAVAVGESLEDYIKKAESCGTLEEEARKHYSDFIALQDEIAAKSLKEFKDLASSKKRKVEDELVGKLQAELDKTEELDDSDQGGKRIKLSTPAAAERAEAQEAQVKEAQAQEAQAQEAQAPESEAITLRETKYKITKEQWIFLRKLQKSGICNMVTEALPIFQGRFNLLPSKLAADVHMEYLMHYTELEHLFE